MTYPVSHNSRKLDSFVILLNKVSNVIDIQNVRLHSPSYAIYILSATSTHFKWELMLYCLHGPTLNKVFLLLLLLLLLTITQLSI